MSPGSTDRQSIPTESRQSPDRVPTDRQLSTDRDRQRPTELRPHLDSDHVRPMSGSVKLSIDRPTDRQTDRPTDRQTAPKHRQTDRECTDLTWMVQPLLDCVRPHWLPVECCQTTHRGERVVCHCAIETAELKQFGIYLAHHPSFPPCDHKC